MQTLLLVHNYLKVIVPIYAKHKSYFFRLIQFVC